MLWAISYILQLLNYCLCYRGIFHVRLKKGIIFPVVMAGTCVIGEILMHTTSGQYSAIVISACVFIAVFFLFDASYLYSITLYPIAFFLTGCINILMSYVLSIATGIEYSQYLGAQKWGVISDGVALLPLLIFLIVSKKTDTDEKVRFRVSEYISLLIGMFCLFLIIAVSQGLMEGDDKMLILLRKPLAICIIILALIFVGGIYWLSYLKNRAIRYQADNIIYKQFIEQQNTHVQDILNADEKMRAFRHDINAHLTALEMGVEEGNLSFLKEYIERMRQETRNATARRYSGISAVDAIVAEWHQKATDEGIRFEWEGKITDNATPDIFDFCVLISNLLSNAVEAAEKVEEGKERFVKIVVGSRAKRIILEISNSCLLEVKANSSIKTTKEDIQNHGFGTRNIKSIIYKMDGEIEQSCENGIYVVSIIL